MSLIRRRKSPGWGNFSLKSTPDQVPKTPKPKNNLKTIKIVNPISGKKINLNGPTHKRLIREKVLDAKGDIRSKNKTVNSRLVPREIPKNITRVNFRFKNDPKFGMINICGWKKEHTLIKNYTSVIIKKNTIHVHFPVFEHFYRMKHTSLGGFSLKDLFRVIHLTGVAAGKTTKYDNDFSCAFAITSSNKGSSIKYQANTGNVFISTQH